MPAKPNPVLRQVAKLMRYHWFRELIMATSSAPKDTAYSDSVPSDVKDGGKAMVLGTKNASLFVTDIAKSREFFAKIVGLKELKTFFSTRKTTSNMAIIIVM